MENNYKYLTVADIRNRIIDDLDLDRLGKYFEYHNVRSKRGISFAQFVELWKRGAWIA